MDEIQLNDNDVVSMSSASNFANLEVCKYSQLKMGLSKFVEPVSVAWVNQGVDCEVLRASTGSGWEKGKIRLRLEFIPD
jgi:hypothetical protein